MIDVDGRCRPVGGDRVVSALDVIVRLGLDKDATAAAATLQPEEFSFSVGVLGATHAPMEGAGVVVPFADAHSAQRRAAAAPVNPAP